MHAAAAVDTFGMMSETESPDEGRRNGAQRAPMTVRFSPETVEWMDRAMEAFGLSNKGDFVEAAVLQHAWRLLNDGPLELLKRPGG